MEIDKKLKDSIIEVRDRLYQQAYEDAKDSESEEFKLRDHLEKNYNSCEIDELVDQIQDLILDSFGS